MKASAICTETDSPAAEATLQSRELAAQRTPGTLRVVHLPVYAENAYQPLLMESLRRSQSVDPIDGGGGGNFLRTALFHWKPDILHFHWLHPYVLRESFLSSVARATRFLCEVALLRRAGCRVVWTVHNLSNHNRRFPKLERFFSVQFARLVDGVILHSHSALAAANQAFKLRPHMRTFVIPQGSYFGHYPNQMLKAECRRRFHLEDTDFVFVFLGRIEPYKGLLDLIGVFKKLESPAQLLIAGRVAQPESLQLLRDAIGDAHHIHLLEGFVPDDDWQTYFNAADAYVYPVRDILNSGSIPPAMSFSLPCIAPRLASIVEILGDDGGILYDSADPSGLLAALRLALVRRPELSEAGAANMKRAKEWTWDRVAEETRRVYDRCLNR